MVVLLNRVLIKRHSSSSKNELSSFINFCIFIASNAEDTSMSVMYTSKSWYNCILPIINLCVHTISPVDRFRLYAAWEADKYCSTFSCILFKVIIDRIFLLVFNKLIGLRFFSSLFSLFAFCSGSKFHFFIFIDFYFISYIIYSRIKLNIAKTN